MAVDRGLIERLFGQIIACGPRAVGSVGEGRAAQVIEGWFAEDGLHPFRQEFTISRWPLVAASRIVPTVAAAGLVLAALVYPTAGWATGLIAVGLVVSLVAVQRWHHFGERLFDYGRQVPCANVIGRSKGAEGTAALVAMAHYDTKSQVLPILLRVVGIGMAALSAAGLVVLSVLAVAGLAVDPVFVWFVAGVGVVGLLGQILNLSGNESVGAMDNASGLAVIGALARELPSRLDGRVDLWVVATGAEELGLGGALRFAQRYGKELDRGRTVCVNFDTVGTGGVVYMIGSRREGDFGEVLLRRLEDRGFSVRRAKGVIGVGVDHMRLSAAGFAAWSLTQGPLRLTARIHTPADRAELVRSDDLSRMVDAVVEAAGELAEGKVICE